MSLAEPYDQDNDPGQDPSLCVLCNMRATSTVLVDGKPFRLCDFDGQETIKMVVQIRDIPARARD